MKRIMRWTATGSRSVISTSFSACSFIEDVHMASKTGERAARTMLCALMCSSPTLTTTSLRRPESSREPSCVPRSTSASGFAPFRKGTDSIREKDTVILHSTVRVSSTSQPFAGSRTLLSGMKPSACSRPMANGDGYQPRVFRRGWMLERMAMSWQGSLFTSRSSSCMITGSSRPFTRWTAMPSMEKSVTWPSCARLHATMILKE
mmetsp:Transcript_55677/g.125533  ORF Transcript_55677/g.125533 Transcript_55677/m.125533 type:complete len:205 (+) Transcript_55677:426-1040(+)